MLDREEAERLVVRLRPELVAFGQFVLGRLEGRRQLRLLVEALEQLTDLAHPRAPRLGVIAERQAQQRQPLDPEQQLTERRLRAHARPGACSCCFPRQGGSRWPAATGTPS